MRTELKSLALILLLLAVALAPAAAEQTDDDLRARVERLEDELRSLKRELERREKGGTAPAAAVPPAAAEAPASAPRPAATTAATGAGGEGARIDVGRVVEAVSDRVRLGGYGSIRYEGSSLEDQKHTFTYRRFVLTADANIAPRLRAYAELEFERFRELELEKALEPQDGGLKAEQTVGGTEGSEIALEQAWLQFDLADWLRFRGGGVLVPLGRFNINHDDNRWDLPRRSLVDRGVPVLPVKAAWDELGAGFLGDLDVGDQGRLDYQVYVVNGAFLDFEFEQIAQTRFPEPAKSVTEVKLNPSTGTFDQDVKDAKAFTGRLAYSPWLGSEVAGSWYYGQYTPDFLAAEDLWSVGVDGRTGWGPFELEGEWVLTQFDGIGTVARQLARTARNQSSEAENEDLESEVEFELADLAHRKHGYWVEARYRFWPSFLSSTVFGRYFDDPRLIAVVRGEQVFLDGLIEEVDFRGTRLTAFETDDRRVDRITAGLAYRPVPLVVFQLAYEFTNTNSGKSLSSVTNFLAAGPHEDQNHGVLVGAAFGF
jgi:hypothetical protein